MSPQHLHPPAKASLIKWLSCRIDLRQGMLGGGQVCTECVWGFHKIFRWKCQVGIRNKGSEGSTRLETESPASRQKLRPRVWGDGSVRALYRRPKDNSHNRTLGSFTPGEPRSYKVVCVAFQILSWEQVWKGHHWYKEAGDSVVGAAREGKNWSEFFILLSREARFKPRILCHSKSQWKPQAEDSKPLDTAYLWLLEAE